MHAERKNSLFPLLLIFLEIAIFLSNDMYLPSMPDIARDLGLTQQQVQNTLTFWFLGSSSLQFILGPISDRYGRRIVVLLGGLFYIISTGVCAVATTLPLLLLARFIQGATICAVLVAGAAAIHELFNSKTVIKIFAHINAVTILAPAFGPLFGAFIVQFANWRYIFWLLFILGTISTILLFLYMPESNKHKHNMNLKRLFHDYWEILCNKGYMLPNISYCLLVAISFLWMFEAPFLMIQTYGTSNLYYGLAQVFIFGCYFIGAGLTNWILNNYDLKKLVHTAIAILIFGTVAFAVVAKLYDSMLLSIVSMMVISTGASMLFAPLTRIGIAASSQPMGRRTAISSTMLSLFGAITGWMVTLIDVHKLATIAALIVGCVALAVVILLFTKIPVIED